jgi:ATP-binding cassette subfamily C (CFTR/MRP) protein 4
MGLISVGIFLLYFPLNLKLSSLYGDQSEIRAKITDERVKISNEIIEGIRLIKMYTWEKAFY